MAEYRVWEDGDNRDDASYYVAGFPSEAAEQYAGNQDSDCQERYWDVRGVTIFVEDSDGVVRRYNVTASTEYTAREEDNA